MNENPIQQSGLIKLTDKEFTSLVSFVHKKYGINLSKKRMLIEGRLSGTLKARGITSFGQYLELLFKDESGSEMTTLLNKITTNYSYFGRESQHFDFLFNVALPYLEKTRSSHVLRIWSAGCSTGQEPYNIAMVIDQYFGAKKGMWDTTILATDISQNVLGKAKAAIYPESNLKDLSPLWRQKYFESQPDGNYQVCQKIKKEVIFRTLNLMDPFVFKKPFDIIFCRNVMIYFDAETTDRLVDKFYNVTAPGGYFCIGHSEVLNKEKAKYKYLAPATYQRGENT